MHFIPSYQRAVGRGSSCRVTWIKGLSSLNVNSTLHWKHMRPCSWIIPSRVNNGAQSWTCWQQSRCFLLCSSWPWRQCPNHWKNKVSCCIFRNVWWQCSWCLPQMQMSIMYTVSWLCWDLQSSGKLKLRFPCSGLVLWMILSVYWPRFLLFCSATWREQPCQQLYTEKV